MTENKKLDVNPPQEEIVKGFTQRSNSIDDLLTIRRVTNGFVVHVGGGAGYEQVDTLVFNFVDDLCDGIKFYYEGVKDESI